jgi:hypothetical protein
MIKSLFIISGLFFLVGLFNFFKKKPTLGWLFVAIGIVGLSLAFIVVSLYPDKF